MDDPNECRERAEEPAGSIIPTPRRDAALDTAILVEHKNDQIISAADCARHLIQLARFGR
jgi:hypothetical protein